VQLEVEEFIAVHERAAQVARGAYEQRSGQEKKAKGYGSSPAMGLDFGKDGQADGPEASGCAEPAVQV
jgi:hypothetical protein